MSCYSLGFTKVGDNGYVLVFSDDLELELIKKAETEGSSVCNVVAHAIFNYLNLNGDVI